MPDAPDMPAAPDDPAARPTAADLRGQSCVPCEGGVPKLSREQAGARLAAVDGWKLDADGTRIRKTWGTGDFMTGMRFFGRIAELAEAESHHPDLHLTDYRRAAVVLSTHAIGGLSGNDFILAAKIDALDGP